MSGSYSRKLWHVVVGIALLFMACGQDSPVSANALPSRTMSLVLGQELDLKLQTVGPGEYASPPTVSSNAIQFLNVSLVAPHVPAGPTQLFRFKAVARGRAIISFHHTGDNPAIEDTVDVR